MNEDPHFANSKVVYTVYDDAFKSEWSENFKEKLKLEGIEDTDLEIMANNNYVNLTKMAISMSDGIIQGSETINPEISEFIKQSGKPVLGYHDEESYVAAYNGFYDSLLD